MRHAVTGAAFAAGIGGATGPLGMAGAHNILRSTLTPATYTSASTIT